LAVVYLGQSAGEQVTLQVEALDIGITERAQVAMQRPVGQEVDAATLELAPAGCGEEEVHAFGLYEGMRFVEQGGLSPPTRSKQVEGFLRR
jgi:hypothetical protein